MGNFITNALGKIFGNKHEKEVRSLMPIVEEINEIGESLVELSHDELRNKTFEFKERINESLSEINEEIDNLQEQADVEEDLEVKEQLFNDIDSLIEERNQELEEVLQEMLPEAFAVVKETARRFVKNSELEVACTEHDKKIAVKGKYVKVKGDKAIWKNEWVAAGGEIKWNMVHYDVQLIGGMVLHAGKIAEMQTGEGKTLVATLPAYLNGLAGYGVHLVTVNDYLARRDSEWVGPIFEFLHLTVDCIDKYKPHTPERKNAYNCDVTYGTNNEFGFDYLRDNMVRSIEEKVQRRNHYVMVDEVDSVLIDDARTPLIISGPIPKGADDQEYQVLKPKIERLLQAQRQLASNFLAEGKKHFKEGKLGHNEGEAGLALLRSFRANPKSRPLIKFLSQEGAKVELQKTENYFMQEQSKHMHIADEPLYFTIDEKNRQVELTEKGGEFLAQGEEDPNLFIMPDIATEMEAIQSDEELSEGEKKELSDKLIRDYSTKSKRLHAAQQLLKAYSLFEKDEEYVVMDGQVKIVDEQTGRIMEGRRYSDGLHQAIEAKENVKIGDITQTYATVTLQNYFRMYHKLAGMTGTAETEASEFWQIYELDVSIIPTNKPVIRDDRQDKVFKTAREKYNAVIEEIDDLVSNGQPVLVGTTSVEISEKLSRMLNLRNIKHNVLNAKQHQREAEIVAEAGKPGAVTIATNMAGRGTDIKISQEVKDAGGLAIIGTERHDSRRVDRQLRGRAGRQGDPGSSQFYISLEDNLMRLFHSEKIAKLMDRMGHKDGEMIQHPMVTKSIERAQKKVEENNFGIRKKLLEYDDVMNIQREAIYKKRDNALSGERLSVDINNMFIGLTETLVLDHKYNGDFESFRRASISLLAVDPSEMDAATFKEGREDQVIGDFQRIVMEVYKRKTEQIKDLLLPVIQRVQENEGHRFKRIAIPFVSSRAKQLPIAADLKEAAESEGKTIMRDIEKTVTLALIDENWKEHLRRMDELKESVQSASFEQKDPLVIYKMEAFKLFEEFIHKVNQDVTSYLLEGRIQLRGEEDIREAQQEKTDFSKAKTHRSPEEEAQRRAAMGTGGRKKVETFVRQEEKVGRNDPCPCGSGKKFKHCHGRA
ncbi:MAG: preprotein translocase subunit SecA [Saprospirales bacterium]|nr:MAG: preprotein translocase subunit SecA [Saprospirales bacterium]